MEIDRKANILKGTIKIENGIMEKMKLLFLCHFSSPEVRTHLELKTYPLRKLYGRIKGTELALYPDFAIWVSDYIAEFKKHKEWEFYVVAPHFGMKKTKQSFELEGIYYHFYKPLHGPFISFLNKMINFEQRTENKFDRRKVEGIVSRIKPDIICLCGAENPYYSNAVLDVEDKPVYVILQTLLNEAKRIEMGVGNQYRRICERLIFQHANYFCTQDPKAIVFIQSVNPKANILPTGFPTHRPEVADPEQKTSDFVFFAKAITPNKGIEDVLKALAIAKKQINDTKLSIIGGIDKDYYLFLNQMIEDLEIKDNVIYKGFYQDINDTYQEVMKSKVVVVPGITASLNSTVRESMLMGLPTICYEGDGVDEINKKNKCLITAKKRDVEDLATLMVNAILKPEESKEIAQNGRSYANDSFSNEAIVSKFLENCKIILESR